MRTCIALILLAVSAGCGSKERLPAPGTVLIDHARREVIVPAVVRHPKDKPCIDDWGQRVQAFAGCRFTAKGDSNYADFFVFLSDVSTGQVHNALLELGGKPRVHYSIPDGKKRSGLKPGTTEADYLQGDPVQLSVFWKEGNHWRERPYQDFAQEKVLLEGGEIVKPWTPHFVFHGSGVIHASGTGCIACPCDCAGGIIADNRNPVFEPKPIVRFDWSKAPPVGTVVYLRILLSPTR